MRLEDLMINIFTHLRNKWLEENDEKKRKQLFRSFIKLNNNLCENYPRVLSKVYIKAKKLGWYDSVKE